MVFTAKALPPTGRTVLITGASTGLGREAALHLAERGFRVLAAVRKTEDGDRLVADCPSGRAEHVVLDVTDQASITAAADEVAEKVGDRGLWGLVNNAGICISAPLEVVSTDLLRRQLEVNVVGQLAVTQAFLPLLRAARGRLVNVTSGLGTVAIPYLGPYSAAQFAKEGMSDALRRELAPLGVAVSVVCPGSIWTPIWAKIAQDGHDALAGAPAAVADLYRATFLRFLQFNEQTAKDSKTRPAEVAVAIRAALTSVKPKTRYRVGADVRRGTVLARVLPDRAVDSMFSKIVTPLPTDQEAHRVGS
ncbi:SDR family oxidoreductase [Saccharothrix texasensis]|uniref:Short-subunit dehydrogenase n=1 Tax=Saccharothrix texasensis TaxID=103734 RepID=A0A3N1H1J3_9PSEU|nr:SDR family oxidoreductase [Saccharothrix texasensis]ROP36401.1 short-subunit dehydrogenase [Saccharothrix texasensis]